MSAPKSSRQALELARRERPEALPAGFAAEVMARLQYPLPVFTKVDAFLIGAVAVLTACCMSLLAGPELEDSAPPPLSVFRGPAGSFPFVTP